MGNETMTDSANYRFYEFDVLASDDAGGYFDDLLIRLSYNSNAFGDSLVQNSNVKISKGSNFNSNTYIDPNANVIDETNTVLGIPFGTDFNTSILNRTLLSSTPKEILHIRITINQCKLPVNIDFFDINFTPLFSFYVITPNSSVVDAIPYDNTDYSVGIYDELCSPIITYFTPTVSTGIGDSITIKGKYFGNDRFNNNGIDTAQIRFRNADKTNLLYMSRLDNADYLYWSDTEIRVAATSLVTTEDLAGIGTGKFIVKNKWGDTVKSNSNLFVEYAIRNYGQEYPDVYLKKRANLIYDTSGYVFAFDSIILNDPLKKAVTEKAIRDWNCYTGANFKILYDDTTQIANSFISFNNNSTSDTIGGNTGQRYSVSCYQNDISKYEIFILGFDIKMNPNNLSFDTIGNVESNKYSYYSMLIHELGHAFQLGHILNSQTELMYPSISNGQYKTFSPNLLSGANDVITYTQTYNYIYCDYLPMIFDNINCGSTNSTFDNKSKDDFLIYPNPFTNQLTVELSSESSDKVEIILYDILGKKIESFIFESGQRVLPISVKNLSEGTYLLNVNINNKATTRQIIKIK